MAPCVLNGKTFYRWLIWGGAILKNAPCHQLQMTRGGLSRLKKPRKLIRYERETTSESFSKVFKWRNIVYPLMGNFSNSTNWHLNSITNPHAFERIRNDGTAERFKIGSWARSWPASLLTVGARYLDAGAGRKKAIASFAASHAWPFENVSCVIVVKRILARRVRAVDRHALEAINRAVSWKYDDLRCCDWSDFQQERESESQEPMSDEQ